MHTVALQPFYDVLNQGLLVLFTGLVAWVVKEAVGWLRAHASFLDAKTDAALGDALDKALVNGLIVGQQKLTEAERALPEVQVNGLLTKYAVQYAVNHTPEAVERFTGHDVDQLAELALARLPTPAAGPSRSQTPLGQARGPAPTAPR